MNNDAFTKREDSNILRRALLSPKEAAAESAEAEQIGEATAKGMAHEWLFNEETAKMWKDLDTIIDSELKKMDIPEADKQSYKQAFHIDVQYYIEEILTDPGILKDPKKINKSLKPLNGLLDTIFKIDKNAPEDSDIEKNNSIMEILKIIDNLIVAKKEKFAKTKK